MQKRNMRVVIASSQPRVRNLLKEMVKEEAGMTIVGQADNGARMLNLTRSLRPDVAIVDSQLPHKMLLDTVPLSQIGGLDTALTTSEEIPNIRVVLLDTNMTFPEFVGAGHLVPLLTREKEGDNTPLNLKDLPHLADADQVIFASLQTQVDLSAKSKISAITDKAILYGSLTLLLGFICIMTLMLAAPGFVLAAAGAGVLLLAAAVKLVSRLWTKSLHRAMTGS